MGYIRHNAIVATGWRAESGDELMKYAESIGAQAIRGQPVVNDYFTICITPDGSKEGWGASDDGDRRRELIREWLEAAPQQSMYFEWCEVVYGSDDSQASIVDSAWGASRILSTKP